MPKLLIIAACLVNFDDDKGGQHAAEGETVTVSKDTAQKLVDAQRALYCEKKDDPAKDGRNTASLEMLDAASAVARDRARAAKAASKAEQTPPTA